MADDDIVTRLIKTTCDLWYCPFSQMAIEAADEIEQLRKDVAFQAKVISRHYEQFASMQKEIERLRQDAGYWKSIAERIHELVFTDGYWMSDDITQVIANIEDDWRAVQYHVDTCRDLGLIPSRVSRDD